MLITSVRWQMLCTAESFAIFCLFFMSSLCLLIAFWPLLTLWVRRRVAGFGPYFRGQVFAQCLPCFQIAVYFLPLSNTTAVKQREACGECAPKMLKWIASTSSHSSLGKLAFEFGFSVEFISFFPFASYSLFRVAQRENHTSEWRHLGHRGFLVRLQVRSVADNSDI